MQEVPQLVGLGRGHAAVDPDQRLLLLGRRHGTQYGGQPGQLRCPGKIALQSGELAERSNAADLKSVSPQGLGGSNPSLSATASFGSFPRPIPAVAIEVVNQLGTTAPSSFF